MPWAGRLADGDGNRMAKVADFRDSRRSGRWHRVATSLSVFFLIGGCERQVHRSPHRPSAAPPASQPATRRAETRPTTMPTSRPVVGVAPARPPEPEEPRTPRRPVDSWTIFRQAFNDEVDASVDAHWTGGNRLDVKTDNVSHLLIDLR